MPSVLPVSLPVPGAAWQLRTTHPRLQLRPSRNPGHSSRRSRRTIMVSSFLREAIKGVMAEVQSSGSLRIVPQAMATFGSEVAALLPLIPTGIKLATLHRRLENLGDYLLLASQGLHNRSPRHGVLLHRAQPYGVGDRHTMDIYVPLAVAEGLQSSNKQVASPPRAPVVFFTHGGVWASGEAWHYVTMATRLAQAGTVVVVHTYTLFPDALVPQMVQEVNAALSWTLDHIHTFGGDPQQVSATGHSAGAHLLALALMHRAHPENRPSVMSASPRAAAAGIPAADGGSSWAAPPPYDTINIPDGRMPARFLGLAGVFDIAKHEEHERSRGVHILSMMTRAMGGYEHFPRHSPSTILTRLAHEHSLVERLPAVPQPTPAQSEAPPVAPSPSSSLPAGSGQPTQFFSSFPLLGDAIPHRLSNLLGAPAVLPPPAVGIDEERNGTDGNGDDIPEGLQASGHGLNGASCEDTTGSGSSGNGISSVAGQASSEGGASGDPYSGPGVAMEAVRRLPPCFMLAGCRDHVVPWHESAEMAAALKRCGVPTRFLLYQFADHADFIMGWCLQPRPRKSVDGSAPASTTAATTPRGSLMSHDDPLLEGLPGCLKDVVRIVLGMADPSRALPQRAAPGAGREGVVGGDRSASRAEDSLQLVSKL